MIFERINNKNAEFVTSYLNINNPNKEILIDIKNLTPIKRLKYFSSLFICKSKNKYMGYVYIQKEKRGKYILKDIEAFTSDVEERKLVYNYMLKKFKNNEVVYHCESIDETYEVLYQKGFCKGSDIFYMSIDINSYKELTKSDNVSFEVCETYNQIIKRCALQNQVFFSPNRVPLTEGDLWAERRESYFIPEGCVFIKYKEDICGYGQLIKENGCGKIVNVCILEEYRNRGMGKNLILYLLNISRLKGMNTIRLQCSGNNESAINLYKSVGFTVERTKYELIKNKQRTN